MYEHLDRVAQDFSLAAADLAVQLSSKKMENFALSMFSTPTLCKFVSSLVVHGT